MSLDITPLVPGGRPLIQGYGGGGFRIAGAAYQGSVLILPERVALWEMTAAAAVTEASLAAVVAESSALDLLLVGCGGRFGPAPADLRVALKRHGLALEWMDTGAACRTFNVLLGEERRVAAALIAID